MLIRFPKLEDLPEGGVVLPDRLWPFIWYFVRQAKKPLIVMLVCFVLAGLCFSSMPLFIRALVDAGMNLETDRGHFLLVLAGFIGVVLICYPVMALSGEWIKAHVLVEMVDMARRQLSIYLHSHSYGFFQNDFAGRLASKVVETPMALHMVVEIMTGPFLIMFCSYAMYIYTLSSAHMLFLGLVAVWFTYYIFVLFVFIPKMQRRSKKASDLRSIVRGRSVDALTNVLQVKLFARSEYEDEILSQHLRNNTEGHKVLYKTLFFFRACLFAGITFLWGSIICSAVWLWQSGQITNGEMTMAFPILMSMTSLSWWVSDAASQFFMRLGEVQEGMETICQIRKVQDKQDAIPLAVDKGTISFDKVTFSYGKVPVFEDFSVDIPAGQKVGLVGPSGAGKSTFVQLLLRMYDLDNGKILIDGQDISNVNQDSLRGEIATIPQVSDLLHRSIYENILYGRLDATREEVEQAAKEAYAHDFITSLSDRDGRDGYEARVGERGVKLSGGQRQRIAIARAILKNAPILVLDEATSALDSESERLIQKSLFSLMQGKTVIAIAHRLSTIAHLDRLLVMDEGKIVEDGTHDELIACGGLYARLWSMQSGGFIGQDDKEQAAAE